MSHSSSSNHRRHDDESDRHHLRKPRDRWDRSRGHVVERFQNRQADRRNRHQQDHYDRQHTSLFSKKTKTCSEDDGDKKKIAEQERKQRMARLRQEIKKEDEDLAALDKHAEDAGTSAPSHLQESQLNPQESIIEIKEEELEGLDEEDQMRKLLGFDGFGSTKGLSVEDNQSTAARGAGAKNRARKYRQYMNRKNGFNRPLEKMN